MALILKPAQQKILTLLKQQKNVLVRLPTGYGKSLCYAYPAKHWGWKVLVISPLKALMEDQVCVYRRQGLRAITWHSGCSREQKQEDWRALEEGAWDLFFLSPETFTLWQSSGILDSLFAKHPWKLIAIDEVHCAVDWKEFREAYAALDEALLVYKNTVQFLALSATLDRPACEQIFSRWPFCWELVDEGLGRANIFLQIQALCTEEEKTLQLIKELKNLEPGRSAIVYFHQRSACDEWAQLLTSAGVVSVSFHAGRPEDWKRQKVKDFLAQRITVVCATTAFGLGIDASHVEKVIHVGLPASLAEYWQQAGRAGRDGRNAKSILLWLRSDILRWRHLETAQKKKVADLVRYCFQSACRKKYLNAAFDLPAQEEFCESCDRCLPKLADTVWWEEYGERNYLEGLFFTPEKKS